MVPPAPAAAPGEGWGGHPDGAVRVRPRGGIWGEVAQGVSPGPGVPANLRSKIFILAYLWTPVIRE
ncbi:hypothetical protein MchiMG62_06730 [Methanoculleus chikugoensis]|uniref:Uncharacterized protein n=1 Tax=Methanoculleus chikugoensis TaxID=118126 RepID=A0ABM7H4F1_9EURY|nr:hypothetical protein MchiMG62_06730 [Methanoculleus chikugoensis]